MSNANFVQIHIAKLGKGISSVRSLDIQRTHDHIYDVKILRLYCLYYLNFEFASSVSHFFLTAFKLICSHITITRKLRKTFKQSKIVIIL